MIRLLRYLNPLSRLGSKNYSSILASAVTFLSACFLEFYAYFVAHNPHVVDIYAIVWFIVLIIYFSFRDGIRGGLASVLITILYYVYIIISRNMKGMERITSLETTIYLGFVYLFVAVIIGGLKQTVDTLIERESNERKRLLSILEQLPVGILITDKKGVITHANNRVETILGLHIHKGFQIGSKPIVQSYLQGKKIEGEDSPLLHTLRTGKTLTAKEYTIERPDSKKREIMLNAAVIHNSKHSIIAAASIISDVTEQKEQEKRKDDFVNMASHELKTPITSMKLYIDLLERQLTKEKFNNDKDLIGKIKKQTDRLQKLVNDLLDVSRLQTGKLVFDDDKVEVQDLLEEVVELYGGTKDKAIELHSASKITIRGDRFRLYQVFSNIINNALKYSEVPKKIIIRVSVKSNFCIISVQDFGIGIEKDHQKKIFERLYQVTDDKEKTFPGFGMGLYIAKEIVARHHGSIWVESEKGKGSTFFVKLPLF